MEISSALVDAFAKYLQIKASFRRAPECAFPIRVYSQAISNLCTSVTKRLDAIVSLNPWQFHTVVGISSLFSVVLYG